MSATRRADAGSRPPRQTGQILGELLTAAHVGPGLAVTIAVATLCVAGELSSGTAALVTAGVFAGQCTIGWGNDLLDQDRDRAVGRTDKPLATGHLPARVVIASLVAAAVACASLSLAAGWRSGVVHLVLGVASGHAYNLWLKATVLSWLPYAVAFGSLPAVVSLAGTSPHLPPGWMVGAAALLGVGAHLLNTLPDLADDAATGVQGLPHRLGPSRTRVVATALLLTATAVVVNGPTEPTPWWAWVATAVVVALASIALTGSGKRPFRAAIAIALVDVVLLAVMAGL